jgi:putative flippase GtrA
MLTDGLPLVFRAPSMATAAQFCRYAMVGVLTNVGAYLLYLAMTLVGFAPSLGATGSFAAALIVGFVLNRKVTFRSTDDSRVALRRYLVTYAIAFLADLAGLHVFVTRAGYPHEIVQLVLVAAIACGLFVAQKYWIFAGETRPAPVTARCVQGRDT